MNGVNGVHLLFLFSESISGVPLRGAVRSFGADVGGCSNNQVHGYGPMGLCTYKYETYFYSHLCPPDGLWANAIPFFRACSGLMLSALG